MRSILPDHSKGSRKREQQIENSAKEPPPKAESTRLQYSPFYSPHILRMTQSTIITAGSHCRKLFEQPSLETFPTSDSLAEPPSFPTQADASSVPTEEPEAFAGCLSAKEFPTFNKENIRKQQEIGFNRLRQVKYSETPRFKAVMGTPVVGVEREFKNKIRELQTRVLDGGISGLPIDADPLKYHTEGYRFFMRLAEGKRKDQCFTSMRALYKLVIFTQPYDEVCWEWIARFEEECGNLKLASLLARTGFLFTLGDSLAEKYVCLRHKFPERPLVSYGDVLATIFEWPRPERRYRVLFELARVCWAYGQQPVAFKIITYLLQANESNLQYLPELVKYYEAMGKSWDAYTFLIKIISERCVKLPIVYSCYLRLAEDLLDPESLRQALDFLVERIDQNMQNDSKWRLLMEVGLAYYRLGAKKQAQHYLQVVLEMAPNMLKQRVYLTILRLWDNKPQVQRISQVMLDINRQRFTDGQSALAYPFQEWKYYFHYSLFYLFDRDEPALELIRSAARRWQYSGRLAAEVLFIERVHSRAEDVVQKWAALASELPKSGEVWCEGGRIYMELQDWKKAQLCFDYAIQLTPQYGDPFIEAYKLCLLKGDYNKARQYKHRVMLAEPFYGNVWCYLKTGSQKVSVQYLQNQPSQNWKTVKRLVKQSLYRKNVTYEDCSQSRTLALHHHTLRQLTAIDEFNQLFEEQHVLTRQQREHLFFAYDQMEPHKY